MLHLGANCPLLFSCAHIIMREHMGEGRYVTRIRNLPLMAETFLKAWVPDEIDPESRGYIAQQFCRLRTALVTGWTGWGLLSIIRNWFQ